MLMAKPRQFLNMYVPDEMMEQIDLSAQKSGLDRSKQARALIAFALGIEAHAKPYIPVAQEPQLPFRVPTRDASPQKSRRRLKSVGR